MIHIYLREAITKAMNKPHQITLSIPTPCHEDWDKMTANEKGRHCANCNKTVVDFTNYTDKELVEFFKKNTGNVCGRMNNYQVNRELLFIEQPNRSFFYKLLYGTALASWFGIAATAGAQNNPSTVKTEQGSQTKKDGKDKYVEDSIRIKGTLYQENTKQSVPFANIVIMGTEYVAVTDIDGHFIFKLPPAYLGKKVTIIVAYPGYGDCLKEIEIKNKMITNIELPMKIVSMGLTQVIIACPKPFDTPNTETHDRNDSPYLSPKGTSLK
jgi:hypothetical protein